MRSFFSLARGLAVSSRGLFAISRSLPRVPSTRFFASKPLIHINDIKTLDDLDKVENLEDIQFDPSILDDPEVDLDKVYETMLKIDELVKLEYLDLKDKHLASLKNSTPTPTSEEDDDVPLRARVVSKFGLREHPESKPTGNVAVDRARVLANLLVQVDSMLSKAGVASLRNANQTFSQADFETDIALLTELVSDIKEYLEVLDLYNHQGMREYDDDVDDMIKELEAGARKSSEDELPEQNPKDDDLAAVRARVAEAKEEERKEKGQSEVDDMDSEPLTEEEINNLPGPIRDRFFNIVATGKKIDEFAEFHHEKIVGYLCKLRTTLTAFNRHFALRAQRDAKSDDAPTPSGPMRFTDLVKSFKRDFEQLTPEEKLVHEARSLFEFLHEKAAASIEFSKVGADGFKEILQVFENPESEDLPEMVEVCRMIRRLRKTEGKEDEPEEPYFQWAAVPETQVLLLSYYQQLTGCPHQDLLPLRDDPQQLELAIRKLYKDVMTSPLARA
eukprot:TRINITY_DN4751_c0_g1_i6.p1 TRINITY_DN4751_c0_g1~~TRINITY_DN4751_c0_g1_i6.p1  ORF type:complete len:503 (+),score=151.56 TRINITY_DN4751_c0_g1_i6:111-1619(+)